MRTSWLALFAAVLLLVYPSPGRSADEQHADAQAEKKPDPKFAALTAEAAGPDFALQGEYSGRLDYQGERVKYGVQVIALGDGAFRAVGYPGGLPGDGWTREEKIVTDGRLEDGTVTFHSEKGTGILKNGKLGILDADGNELGTLEKVIRKSPTLGAKPIEGAVVLFDGTSADNFENGRLSEDGYLMEGVTSKQKFGSFKLHLEFMLSFMPYARGQGRANSGCYLQGRYEVQILDSFGLEGKNNEAGGIYEISDPSQNMCFPPLSWQTYDIDYTAAKFDADGNKIENARITVAHNGVIVQRDVELPRATRAAPVKEGPEPGPIYLQNHGNPIRFRNIWLIEK